MIGRLTGILAEKKAPHLLIDIGGVGYDVIAPMTTFYRLPALGEKAVLHTHFSVSETSQQLFGFSSQQDRELFRMLIKVNGVGPKLAVGIMSKESSDFAKCVLDGNLTALVKLPGVGKKTAERLLVDMRDRVKALDTAPSEHSPTGEGAGIVRVDPVINTNVIIADAESALIGLGYKPTEAAKAVSAAYNDTITTSEDLIRAALKGMI